MRTCVLLALAILALATPARAQDNPDIGLCFSSAPTPQAGIAACTRLLRSGEIDANQRHLAFANRGLLYLKLKQPALALRDANQALVLLPQGTFAKFVRGAAHYMLNQRAAAIRDLRDALKDPDRVTRDKSVEMLRNLGVDVAATEAAPETESAPQPFIDFRIRNRTGSPAGVAFYSHTRRWCWPRCDQHYPLRDAEIHTHRVFCNIDELVCWGAWHLGGDTFWGVGKENTERCERCCYRCRGQTTPIQNLDP